MFLVEVSKNKYYDIEDLHSIEKNVRGVVIVKFKAKPDELVRVDVRYLDSLLNNIMAITKQHVVFS